MSSTDVLRPTPDRHASPAITDDASPFALRSTRDRPRTAPHPGCPARSDRPQEAAGCREAVAVGGATAPGRSIRLGDAFFAVRGVGVSERRLDALADQRVTAVEALGVDPEQDLDRVPGPLGHHGRGHAAVESGGHGRVPKVVGRFRPRPGRGAARASSKSRPAAQSQLNARPGPSVLPSWPDRRPRQNRGSRGRQRAATAMLASVTTRSPAVSTHGPRAVSRSARTVRRSRSGRWAVAAPAGEPER
jgi:hypothetical protein